MSLPRPIYAGRTYLVTRRCTQRQLLLRPGRGTNAILRYCYAVAAQRSGVVLVAVCAMSNHHHLVVYDPHGRLPEFTHWLHEFVAKCLNAKYGRRENLWNTTQSSYDELVDAGALVEAIAYVIANPVRAGLVGDSKAWPGVCSRPEDVLGREEVVARPPWFFRDGGEAPKEAVLRLAAPPVPGMDAAELAAAVRERVNAKEREVREQFAAEGRRFLGAARVLRQPIDAAPTSAEPPARRVGVKASGRAARRWARRVLAQFRADYHERRESFCAGEREAPWPAGTYQMHVVHGCPVLAPPHDPPLSWAPPRPEPAR